MRQPLFSILYSLSSILVFAPTAPAHPGHDDAPDPTSPVYLALLADPRAAASNLPAPSVTIETRDDGYRYITSNGLPNHATGQFPGPHNPNTIAPQNYHFRMPLRPKSLPSPVPSQGPILFGVALNGVPFDPGTAEFWHNDRSTGWRMEALNGPRNLGLDAANAHVQPGGQYHYHAIPTPLLTSKSKPTLIGYAADGYPIYGPYGYSNANDPASPLKELKSSYKLKDGNRPADAPPGKYDGSYTRDWTYVANSGDLDESNGRTGVTPEYPDGTYYYVLTNTFPFVPRFFHAQPDPSFSKGPPGGGPGGRPRGPRPPRPE